MYSKKTASIVTCRDLIHDKSESNYAEFVKTPLLWLFFYPVYSMQKSYISNEIMNFIT